MRAAVLRESPGELVVEDITVDTPDRREVLVRVSASGLCHSDQHVLDGNYPMAAPTVLGHEGAGIVEAVGEDVTFVKPGDHVVSFPTPFCGQCEWCLSGRPTLCLQQGLGRPVGATPRLSSADGSLVLQMSGLSTFAELMLVHENALVPIDPEISLTTAALVGCGVPTGIGAVLRTAQVREGATVAVVGCGGVGLNAIQGAVLAAASRIIAVDINDGKLATAKKFGATDTINNVNGDALEQLNELLPGQGGVDYSFEALGRPQTYELAFALLRRGGTATVMGVGLEKFELPMSGFLHERKIQGSLMGSANFRTELPFILRMYQAGRLKLDELVSNRIPLDQINQGFADMKNGDIARSVVVFD